MSTSVAKVEQLHDPMAMVAAAVERGVDSDQLSKLMDLQERWEAKQAKRAYDEAMAAFHADPIVLRRDKEGHNTRYASHHQMMRKVAEKLHPLGLSHAFIPKQEWVGEKCIVSITCRISHEQGHCEEFTMSSLPDVSGGKNPIQAIGSAKTYLERYTLKGALGLGEEDDETDDDGQSSAVSVYRDDLKYVLAAAVAWKHRASIDAICENLDAWDAGDSDALTVAAEAAAELSTDDKRALWVAPSKMEKAGFPIIFPTRHRELMKSSEFTAAIAQFTHGDEL